MCVCVLDVRYGGLNGRRIMVKTMAGIRYYNRRFRRKVMRASTKKVIENYYDASTRISEIEYNTFVGYGLGRLPSK